ncbi:FAD-binding oxidoreductase [Methylacidimicrobium sp. B4]|uniref:FAD-binding oxidoreductase n=1 Tax=Methylacidimicrobium sp. B4 TaxID=2796139 RepID=UPI001F5D3AB9|nr:FAD-linked oxidase C-terminal domain-containing protein [Methylacidimicrobium sp. B4]
MRKDEDKVKAALGSESNREGAGAPKENWVSALLAEFPEMATAAPEALAQNAGDAWLAAHAPQAVFYPESAESVVRLARWASEAGVPITPRGAGRGYVGGCVPVHGGIVVNFSRMNRIREIDPQDGVAVVEPGVVTAHLQEAVAKLGWFYPPDPASAAESSLGGNVATNAGGPRCLKYGVTRHYVLGLEVVLADGTRIRVGGRTHKNKVGFDLVGLFVGSEGLLGLVTEATLRLIPRPPYRIAAAAVFPSIEAAAGAVEQIFAAGFLPSALEIADRFTLERAREFCPEPLPPGEAHLLVECDGQPAGVDAEIDSLLPILRRSGAGELLIGRGEEGCERLWRTRRSFSMALKASNLTKLNEDVVVPRRRLVDLVRLGSEIEGRYGFPVACFGHAGDGNIHVNLMIDRSRPGADGRAEEALDLLFRQIVAWGGSITGEHGIGIAKERWWPLAVSPEVRSLHERVKSAFDPKGLLNPGKFV